MRALAADGTARRLREAAGISLREAASAVQTHPATLSRGETGKQKPSPELALRWAAMLDQLQKVRL